MRSCSRRRDGFATPPRHRVGPHAERARARPSHSRKRGDLGSLTQGYSLVKERAATRRIVDRSTDGDGRDSLAARPPGSHQGFPEARRARRTSPHTARTNLSPSKRKCGHFPAGSRRRPVPKTAPCHRAARFTKCVATAQQPEPRALTQPSPGVRTARREQRLSSPPGSSASVRRIRADSTDAAAAVPSLARAEVVGRDRAVRQLVERARSARPEHRFAEVVERDHRLVELRGVAIQLPA